MNPKIYIICLDAYPETPELMNLMTERKLQRSELICSGAFTTTTITSMISGCLGSEIIPGGIGYNSSYSSEFFKWRPDHCIVDRLRQSHIDIRIHNHVPWFSRILAGKELTDKEKTMHYRDHLVNDENIEIHPFGVIQTDNNLIYSSTNPEITLNTFIKWNFPDLKDKFYSNEKEYIKYIQSKTFSGLFLTDLCHWHEYVYYRSGQIKSNYEIIKEDALSDSINWLGYWDFDEPNSIFYVFADHSHRVNSYLDPPSYMTWVYYKDNVSGSKINPIISSNDFYLLSEKIFKLDPIPKSIWTSDPFGSYDPNRIYAVEDGRANSVIKTTANAFGRCCQFNNLFISMIKLTDSTNYPSGIYLILTTLNNKNTYTVYRFDDFKKNYIESFSIQCNNGLDNRVRTSELLYELTPDIKSKAEELYFHLQK